MSQINYNIIEELLKQPNHIRELARVLKTNQTTIARKINQLKNNNIVDYKLEGKNKIFFIKNTEEAKQFCYITEHNKLLRAIQKYPIIRNILKELLNNNIIILFGSYANFTANKKSDVDIFIQTKNNQIKSKISEINSKINVKIGEYDSKNLLIKEIESNHIILKGVEEYYGQNKFFENIKRRK